MSGLFGWGSRNTQVNKLGSVQIQTSEYGVCIPVLFGSNRLAAKLIDYLAFTAKKTEQGGKGGGGVSGYEYFAAVLLLLWKNGQYASGGVGNIFDAGGAMELVGTSEEFTIPGGGGTHTVSHSGAAFYYDEGVTYQAAYSTTVNDYGSDGSTTLSGFNTMPMQKVTGTPSAGQYKVNATGTYTFAAADAGKLVTISYSYTPTPNNQSVISDIGAYAPAQYLNLSIFNGTRPQAPWGFLAGYADHTLDYPGLALAADPNMDLGSSATVPSYNFEGLNGCGRAYGGGIADCDPSVIINDILTDPFIGMGYAYLGDLTQMSNYCVANGIFFSPYYDSAKACSAVIEEIAKLANTEVFTSWDGLLKAVPYGDTTMLGFGKTFTPVTQPLYDFDINDFVQDGDEDPLRVSLPDLMDNSNYMKIEFKNRAKSYNVDTIDGINQASINVIGLRPADQITAHMITETEVAQIVLDALLTRASYPYRTFEWKLPPTFPHLEIMDVVTVTHPNPAYGITRWPVRIKGIEEDEQTGELSITAEDFPWGAGQPAKYDRNPGGGNPLPGREFPGDVVAPVIFEVPDRISRSGGPEVWIGTTGQGDNWGGASVWMSKDGTNYDKVGTIQGSARMGELRNSVGAVADPDTTSTFDIELAGADPGPLTSSSTAAADGALTLCLLDSELISFSTVAAATVGGTGGGGGGTGGTGAPVIPSDALTSGILDNASGWAWEHDPATTGTSTGTSSFVSTAAGRHFTFSYTNHGGQRYHVHAGGPDTSALYFCYDLEFMTTTPGQILNLELDMNQVITDGRTVLLCTQAAHGSHSWEYTLNGSPGWHASTVTTDPQGFTPGVYHHIRIFTHRSADGNTTYYDGVEFDGVYTAFEGTATGPSAKSLGWKPIGLLLINFQMEGSSAGSGSVDCYGRNIQVWRWVTPDTGGGSTGGADGTPVQQLTTYTRRGLFGTGSAAHGDGSLFLRLDDAVFSYEYDPLLVGTTLHFKLTSFNLIGAQEQGLADVSAYTFLLTGKFGNSEKSIQNNMVLDSVVHSGGATADIRVYRAGTSAGTAGVFTRDNGTTVTAPAGTITGEAFGTTYYIAWNPSTGNYTAFTDYGTYQLWLTYGLIGVGIVTTLNSDGSGGTTGGGGSSGRGILVTLSQSSASTTTGGSVTITATVTGSSIQDVVWSLGSGATTGSSVTGSGNSGTFHAAATAHGGGAIIATSVADSSVSAGCGVSW